MGDRAFSQGDLTGANLRREERVATALPLEKNTQDLGYALRGLTDVIGAEGHGTESAQRQGSVSSLLRSDKTRLQRFEQLAFVKTRWQLRFSLGKGNYHNAFEIGRRLSR